MKLLDQYLDLQKQIFEYFGYKEDWLSIPLDDYRDYHWIWDSQPDGKGTLIYHEEKITPELIQSGGFYQDLICAQRFLPQWVYRGQDFTLISVDPRTDGNKFLAVLDNAKEQQLTPELNPKSFSMF